MVDPRTIEQLVEADKRSVMHPATAIADHLAQGPRIMEAGKGVYVSDIAGDRFLDGVGGLWCVNPGYGRAELGQAMADAAGALGYFHSFTGYSNRAQIELAEKIKALAGGAFSRVFFGSSGSDANDSLIKLIWYVNALRGKPGKRKIIARKQSYHGTTVATASLTGLPAFHRLFGLPIADILHTETPHHARYARPGETEAAYARRLAADVDATIVREGADTVAAFFAEPIIGAGGVIVPPEGYFQEIEKVCRKHEVLLVADEVVCGYGRLGTWFGHQHFGFTPDLMSTAKGLTSGYFPMSAALISEPVWRTLEDGAAEAGTFAHGFTYSGHPVGAAVALKNLEIMERERVLENVQEVGPYLQAELRRRFADHPLVGEVRGVGLVAAVQMVADKTAYRLFDPKIKMAARVVAEGLDEGIILRSLATADAVAFSPALIITKAETDRLLDGFAKALDRANAGLTDAERGQAA